MVLNGEYTPKPPVEVCDSAAYAWEYVIFSPLEKLYTFAVTEAVLEQLQDVAARYMQHFIGRNFKSLEVLQTLC